jgi:uncharacterized protein (DUF1778 family)
MARPTINPESRKTFPLMVMLSAEQKAIIKKAAEAAGLDMSTWIRSLALRAADSAARDQLQSERQ